MNMVVITPDTNLYGTALEMKTKTKICSYIINPNWVKDVNDRPRKLYSGRGLWLIFLKQFMLPHISFLTSVAKYEIKLWKYHDEDQLGHHR